MEHRPAENGPAVSKRFELAKEKLDAKGGAELDAFMKRAENPGQRVLLERALAAGHTIDQIHGLLLVMNGMSEAEVMSAFTGHGIVQFFAQSCVPTSYQIALAEIDPLFALKLRNNPQMVIEAQGQALKDGGGQAHKRYDTKGKEQFQDPEVKKALGDKNRYDHDQNKSSGGIESTEMKDQELHKQLEAATGAKYEIITNDSLAYKKEGDGKFPSVAVPFDRINAALDQGLPVIIGTMNPTGHAQVIIGHEVGPDGKTQYIISDPMSGTTYKLGAEAFGFLKVQSVTIPDTGGAKKTEPAKGAATPDPSKSTTTGGTDGKESKAKTDEATTDTAEAKQLVDKNKDNQTPQTTQPKKEGEVPPAVKDGWDKSAEQKSAMEGANTGKPSESQRELLQNEIRRQVPDVALAEHIQDPAKGGAAVVSVVFPGGGPFGIKKMNDDVLGQRFNDALIADRNGVVQKAFAESGLTVVDQNYKVVTLVSKAPAAELGAAMSEALKKIDAEMPEVIKKHLQIAKAYYEGELAKGVKDGQETPDQKAAKKHLQEIADLEGTMNDKLKKGFAVEIGAADLHGTEYKDIVETSMNASKAAIMARDGGGGEARAKAFSEEGFVEFVHETMEIRNKLQGMELPVHGQMRSVIIDGKLDREILWAVRKDKLGTLTEPQKKVLAEVERYIKRVNSLDYMAPYKGGEIEGQGQKVKAAQDAIAALGKENLSAEDSQKIREILNGSVAQQNAASEAQFFNAAAADKGQRVVINADIKDMGLDLWGDLESGMGKIDASAKAKDPNQRETIRNTSANAADRIVQRKRDTHNKYLEFYQRMLETARRKASNNPALLAALEHEGTPLYLQGGDEITLSISPVFRQLGMEHEFVQFLFENANARVAITDANGGTDGHREAMKKADSGHKELKKYEEVRRAISNEIKSDRLTGDRLALAEKLVQEIDTLYTQTNESGETELHGRAMKPEQIRAEADRLLGANVVTGILGKQEGS